MERPRTLLVDLHPTCWNALHALTIPVESGTFGPLLRLDETPHRRIAFDSAEKLRDYNEMDIVVIDLCSPPMESLFRGQFEETDQAVYYTGSSKIIDSRVLAMANAREDFDRILANGGCFVIFAEPRISMSLTQNGQPFQLDNWNFLSCLNQKELYIKRDLGKQFRPLVDSEIGTLLAKHRIQGHDSHSVTLKTADPKDLVPFALSLYEECVGGILKTDQGLLLLLPNIYSKADFLEDLFTEVLPQMCPKLFPDIINKSWTKTGEYELDEILELQNAISTVRAEADQEIANLHELIECERRKWAFLFRMLTDSGDELVKAVTECLQFLGFENIVDMDEHSKPNLLQEDIQIRDRSPLLVGEIKGVTLTRENHTQQISKFVSRRMRELNRLDVQGLLIINHQRNLPPKERAEPFTPQQIDDATSDKVTLISTWNLFLLAEGIRRKQFEREAVKDLLYIPGLLQPYPKNFVPSGKVKKHWGNGVCSVELDANGLQVEDTIALQLNNGMFITRIQSMQRNNLEVDAGLSGETVGVICEPPLLRTCTGIVFRVE